MSKAPANTKCSTIMKRRVASRAELGVVHTRPDERFLNELTKVFERNYAKRTFGLVRMAAAMKVSQRHLQRKLKALIGYRPAEYLRVYRMQRSLPLLRAGIPIGVVAKAVGFSSHAYFSCCFKAQFGITPTKFQQDWI